MRSAMPAFRSALRCVVCAALAASVAAGAHAGLVQVERDAGSAWNTEASGSEAGASEPWSFEFEQLAWSPLRSLDAAKAAVTELRGPRWSTDDSGGLRAYDLDAGVWWNQAVGAVVRARVVDDADATGPQAMLADAFAAWRVAGSASGSVDLMAGARVAAGIDAGAAGQVPGLGGYQSESALVLGMRAKAQVVRGISVGVEGDVAPRVSGAGVAWKVGAGATVDLGSHWSMSVDAGWRTLDAALNEAVGGVPGRSEGAVWVGFSKRF